jgi:zinc transport system substrate-binding protein
MDPHLWLDPVLMGSLVEALPGALRAHGVAAADAEGVAATLRAEIDGVHAAYQSGLAPFAGRAIITHHNAFQRVADRYGLTVAQVVRPVSAVEPTPGDLSRVSAAVAASGVGAIFVEPQFPDTLPRRIADRLGLAVFTLDPEGSDDWAGMMRSNLEALIAGLSAEPGSRAEPAAAEESDG